MFEFRVGTKIVMGENALDWLANYQDRNVFVVTDEFLSTTPVCGKIAALLGSNYNVFKDVPANPNINVVAAGAQAYLACQPEVIIAFGGGSVMDAAKAMHLIALEQGKGAPDGLIAIPSTSGSGSEMTSFAVITDAEREVKVPLSDEQLVPKVAILDPQVVASLPKKITADSGLDALTHAIEANVSNDANDFSDALAEKAFDLIFANLPTCYAHGEDLPARAALHDAACMAAVAFDNSGLGITHSLAHAIGGHFHVAHGRLNAILLTSVIAYNAEHSQRAADRYGRLARRLNPGVQGKAAVTSLISKIDQLRSSLDVPSRLSEAGIDRTEITNRAAQIASMAFADPLTQDNPAKVSEEDLLNILLTAI